MKRVLIVLLFALSFSCFINAGAAVGQDTASAPPSLALQINIGGHSTPSFDPVPATGVMTQWYTYFPRTPLWKEPEGVLPILAVRFAYRMKGERVSVRVTVHRGMKFYDVEEFVAEYEAATGESHVVSGLTKFGIVPFEFKVVKRAEVAPRVIAADNLTSSVEVVSAEVDRTSSAVRLLLRNHSPWGVTALKLQTVKAGVDLTTMWPLGREGQPLIEAGGVYEIKLGFSGAGVKQADGYAPVPPDSVKVTSALFSDGSYEGERQPAAQAAGNYAGYRIQLSRMLDLIHQSLNSPDADTPEAAARFKEKVLALGRDAEPSAVDEVFYAYPGLAEGERDGIKSAVEVAMSWLRQDVLAQLAPFEAGNVRGTVTFRWWLSNREKQFNEWLARLSH
jgi:hypothetical protein